jgi:hypothetical protein
MVTALRLLFSLSKKKTNDFLFRQERIVHTLLELLSGEGLEEGKKRAKKNKPRRARVRFKLDVLTYATGTLKNICTLDKENQAIMAQQGAITTLASMLNAASNGKGPHEKQVAQLLVQITGTLRNLCGDRKHFKQFWNSRVVQTLCGLVCNFPMKHSELMLNIVRILSKLSLHAGGRSRIAGDDAVDAMGALTGMLQLCQKYADHNAMMVRTFFVLGNLTAGESDVNRNYLANATVEEEDDSAGEADGQKEVGEIDGIETITGLLARHTVNMIKANILAAGNLTVEEIRPKETAEVLVKIIRLIANMAIAPSPGLRFSCSSGIKCLVTLLADVPEKYEELQLNVISAISNLSFYAVGNMGGREGDSGPAHFMAEEGSKVIDLMIPFLLKSDREEGVLEVARAFANFSRIQSLRSYMAECRADEIFVLLLEHNNRDIVLSVCGVLINLAACKEGKQLLRRRDLGGFGKLLGAVRDAGMNDLEMSTLSCKVMHNACLNGANVASREDLGDDNIERIYTSLEELIDVAEDIIEDVDEDGAASEGYDSDSDDLAAEREFLEVASGLLRTLRSVYQPPVDDELIPLDDAEGFGVKDQRGKK